MKRIRAKSPTDVPIDDAAVADAIGRGRQRTPAVNATGVRYSPQNGSLWVEFADRTAVALPVQNYPEFARLKPAELKRVAIGFGGSALCLDECDLHVSIAGLMSASSALSQLAASIAGLRNGSRRSVAKAQASRENGLKGGRPRKLAPA